MRARSPAETIGLGLLALVAGAAPSRAAAYSGLYVFGDSLSDVGNVSLSSGGAIPGAPYWCAVLPGAVFRRAELGG